jgi:hypothetical protein
MNKSQLAQLQEDWAGAQEMAEEVLLMGEDTENPEFFVWSSGNRSQTLVVASLEDAVVVINAWTLADLIDPSPMSDCFRNAFGLIYAPFDSNGVQVVNPRENGDEWYDEQGRDICELVDSLYDFPISTVSLGDRELLRHSDSILSYEVNKY